MALTKNVHENSLHFAHVGFPFGCIYLSIVVFERRGIHRTWCLEEGHKMLKMQNEMARSYASSKRKKK
jgi:hypothetical protein